MFSSPFADLIPTITSTPLIQSPKGDWIDLYTHSMCRSDNNTVSIKNAEVEDVDELQYKQGDVVIVSLGVAMQLPPNHEAEIRPRSSTFQNTGLLLTNSVGTIDNSYCGDNDIWMAKFYATRDGSIKKGDRLVQFRVTEKMKNVEFVYVDKLGNKDRGSYGSTGV